MTNEVRMGHGEGLAASSVERGTDAMFVMEEPGAPILEVTWDRVLKLYRADGSVALELSFDDLRKITDALLAFASVGEVPR